MKPYTIVGFIILFVLVNAFIISNAFVDFVKESKDYEDTLLCSQCFDERDDSVEWCEATKRELEDDVFKLNEKIHYLERDDREELFITLGNFCKEELGDEYAMWGMMNLDLIGNHIKLRCLDRDGISITTQHYCELETLRNPDYYPTTTTISGQTYMFETGLLISDDGTEVQCDRECGQECGIIEDWSFWDCLNDCCPIGGEDE